MMKAKAVLPWLVFLIGCTGCRTGPTTAEPIIGITSVYDVDKAHRNAIYGALIRARRARR